MKYLILGIMMITTQIFAQDADVSLYEVFTFNKPKLNIKTEVYLGDRMVEQAEGSYRVCVVPKETRVVTKMGQSVEYKANEPICKRKEKDRNYYNTVQFSNRGAMNMFVYPVRVRTTRTGVQLSICQMGLCAYKVTFPKNSITISDRTFVYSENSFQQSIEYTGKTGDKLNFTYAETYGDLARAPFTRNFEIDLSEGDVAAFKGAIIKIHKATNVSIIYSVIRNFQS